MTLRSRILISFVPLILLLAALGGAGLILLYKTGGRIDAILRENYVSVQAMFRVNEAVERIDSAFQFALSAQVAAAPALGGMVPQSAIVRPTTGKEGEAKAQFDSNWELFDSQFQIEEDNITILPREQQLVDQLRAVKTDYLRRGREFFHSPRDSAERYALYYGHPSEPGRPADPGLLGRFEEIKSLSGEIIRINQENMEQARDEARETARTSLIGFSVGFSVLILLASALAWLLVRTFLRPIRAITEAAQAIGGSGQLDRVVPVFGRDELGTLAKTFNAMTRQLRQFRRSNLATMMRAQQTAQATIDSFPDPVLVVDPGSRVELVNPAAQSLFGVGPSEEGQPGPTWQPPEPLRQPLADALQTQRAHQTESFEQAMIFRLGGEDRTYLPQIRPIRDANGDTLGAAVVLNDVTRFRLLDQFKSDLVATVSHELKTPLTGLRLAVHVLLEETVGPLSPKQTELLIDARDNAERLLTLIDQMLALARLQHPQDQPEMQSEDPVVLLRRAADGVRGERRDKRVELDIVSSGSLPSVEVDPARIDQALGNLLLNAVTYTPAGGHVTLSASLAPNNRVLLSIADTGVGIPKAYLPHVFERFFRIPGQSNEAGTGLGLAIVKEVVTAHRGEINCESELGKGTVFNITLPATGPIEGDGHVQ